MMKMKINCDGTCNVPNCNCKQPKSGNGFGTGGQRVGGGIRDKGYPSGDAARDRLRRKANQEWDMAGLARQDGDMKDSAKHTEKARDYERQIQELG